MNEKQNIGKNAQLLSVKNHSHPAGWQRFLAQTLPPN